MISFNKADISKGIGLGISHSAMAQVANESPGTSVADSTESAENGSKGWRGKRSTAFCLPCQVDFGLTINDKSRFSICSDVSLCSF